MIIVDECGCIFRRDASERFVNQEYDFKLNTLFKLSASADFSCDKM